MPPVDYLIFATSVGLTAVIVLGWLYRRSVLKLLSLVAGLTVMGLLVAVWFLVQRAESVEKSRLQETVAGLAPTYALEMARLGHADLTFETPPDDPVYLQIIEAQKRWLNANPRLASMYTCRFDGSGKLRFAAACETDYDHSGSYEGEREARVPIGETYEVDAAQKTAIQAAAGGQALFSEEPLTDRWGTWVSAFHPLRDRNGKTEGVMGVDFDATEWIEQIQRARISLLVAYGLGAILALAALGGLGMWMVNRDQHAQLREAVVLRTERAKFETLVDSIEGVVFEMDPLSGRFTYVSRQAATLLNLPLEDWTAEAGFLGLRMHADDAAWAVPARAAALKAGVDYLLEYRLRREEDEVIWVRERGRLTGGSNGPVVRGIIDDITARKAFAEELEATHRQLVVASRQAGMAEVATGVLHNVGNVLNSVNISSSVIHEQLKQSRVSFLKQLSGLIDEQGERLPEFIRDDERGRRIPAFLRELSARITEEHASIGRELTGLVSNVEHIKDIVLMQQGYARLSGRTEKLDLVALLEDALHINESTFARHRIRVVKQLEPVPVVLAERGKVLQILVNLIRNAKHALDDGRKDERVMTLSIMKRGQSHVGIAIEDNGIGIAPEILPRICNYGFTTRTHGHGFGLHSGAAAARDMGGKLTVASPGPGLGATFTLELPVSPEQPESPATSLN